MIGISLPDIGGAALQVPSGHGVTGTDRRVHTTVFLAAGFPAAYGWYGSGQRSTEG
jgi:hypothetical protein